MASKLRSIGDNNNSIDQLLEVRDDLVPFIGAGFSCPVCPGWGAFLDAYFERIKEDFFTDEDLVRFENIKVSENADRFEHMADFLIESSGRRQFAEELQSQFGLTCPAEQKQKFQQLHQAFPGLKVTTNYDRLIEDNHPSGKNVEIARGNRPDDLERLFTKRRDNCLLKIHGGLRDINSIVLASQHYQEMYGDEDGFDPATPLPDFLQRLFTNSSVLFIGCSLEYDRVLAVLQSLDDVRPHFALMKRPQVQDEKVSLNRRLSNFQIKPIWFEDFDDIPELLRLLAPMTIDRSAKPPESITAFVGREKELDQIRNALDIDEGSIQMISGRLFNVEGAGGVGKTTLALEAAARYGHLAKDGVLGPFRADEMNAQAYALELARALDIPLAEPPADNPSAQTLITAMLKDRRCLIILDNAVDWKSLRYMLPKQSPAIIIVTTRDRDMGTRLRDHFHKTLSIDEITLNHFTPKEALNLFRELLMDGYRGEDEDRYASIAKELGYLPIALHQVIALIKYSPHYTAQQLMDKLAADGRLALLRKGQAAEDSDERSIDAVFDLASPALGDDLREALEYLAVCAPGPIPLSFLQRLTGNEIIGELLEQLHTYSWCERRDESIERHYELHQLVRELIFERFGRRYTKQFIDTVDKIFLDETIDFKIKDNLIAQLNEALNGAEQTKDDGVIQWLYSLYQYCTFRGHHVFYVQLTEVIERTFGDDQETLAASLANRALILQDWGQLDEAMALHKKEEKIKEALGDQAGLARSYGNQALILQAWGQLDEAMALHKKEEKIKEALGDQAGLARTWWNQGIIFGEQGQRDRQIKLWKHSIEINQSMGIPTEEDEKALNDLQGAAK